MKKLIFAALTATTLGQPATAQDIPGIQNHDVQKRFLLEPCSAVIDIIDNTDGNIVAIAEMAMTFGFLMGFEANHPYIRGPHDTVLMRLRDDCTTRPTATAMDILLGYAEELP